MYMHKKNKLSKNKSYIQGLRPISTTIPKNVKKIIRKSGYNFSTVVDKWNKIVSKEISSYSYPIDVKIGRDLKNGIIFLNVEHGKEIDIEYNKQNIIDQINSFFGYNYLDRVKLFSIHNKKKYKKEIIKKDKKIIEIDKFLKSEKNEDLKKKLENFINAYNENNS